MTEDEQDNRLPAEPVLRLVEALEAVLQERIALLEELRPLATEPRPPAAAARVQQVQGRLVELDRQLVDGLERLAVLWPPERAPTTLGLRARRARRAQRDRKADGAA